MSYHILTWNHLKLHLALLNKMKWPNISISNIQYKYGGVNRYNLLIITVLGACAALALPPISIIAVLILSFSVLLYYIDHAKTARHAFFLGWYFGIGFFIAGLYWLTIALLIDIKSYWFLIPFAVPTISAILALYTGLCSYIMFKLKNYCANAICKIILFSCLWSFIEWVRGCFLVEFPWNLIGYACSHSLPLLQVTSLVSIYGLSTITIMISCSLYLFMIKDQHKVAYMVFCISVLAILYIWGSYRLAQNPTQYSDHHIRLVQANIKQELKWNKNLRDANIQKYMDLSYIDKTIPEIIIWPESAFTKAVSEQQLKLHDLTLSTNDILITGAPTYDNTGKYFTVYNTLLLLNDSSTIEYKYHKHQMVAFGEYIPFRDTLTTFLPIKNLTNGMYDFTPGYKYTTISNNKIPPFIAAICYEIIFPELILNQDQAEWIVNITNDGWFRDSSGPYQHLAMSRVRAVESGLPVARAAYTGISAIIDGYGRLIHHLPYNRSGYIADKLPLPANQPTIFRTYGFPTFFGLNICLLLIVIIYTRRKARSHQ